MEGTGIGVEDSDEFAFPFSGVEVPSDVVLFGAAEESGVIDDNDKSEGEILSPDGVVALVSVEGVDELASDEVDELLSAEGVDEEASEETGEIELLSPAVVVSPEGVEEFESEEAEELSPEGVDVSDLPEEPASPEGVVEPDDGESELAVELVSPEGVVELRSKPADELVSSF